jgi:hypothetical protein
MRWVMVGLFGLFFAYDVWEGVGNFLGVQGMHFSLGLNITAFGWFCIVLGVVAPILLFVGALLLTRKMGLGRTFTVFVMALTVSAIVGADLVLGTSAYLLYDAG